MKKVIGFLVGLAITAMLVAPQQTKAVCVNCADLINIAQTLGQAHEDSCNAVHNYNPAYFGTCTADGVQMFEQTLNSQNAAFGTNCFGTYAN